MQKLNIDLGIKEFEIGNGVLRFNPSDPNVYARFVEACNRLTDIEAKLVAGAETDEGKSTGEVMLRLMTEADRETKNLLAWIFGANNDFDAIFGGANILAVGENGERIITNFIMAIKPIMEAGAEKCAKQQVDAATTQARLNRAQRRAAAKK